MSQNCHTPFACSCDSKGTCVPIGILAELNLMPNHLDSALEFFGIDGANLGAVRTADDNSVLWEDAPGTPRLCVGRMCDGTMFSLVCALPSPASVEGCPSLFGWFIGSTAQSDFSSTCMSAVRFMAFTDRP
jgi:hypothetical protein